MPRRLVAAAALVGAVAAGGCGFGPGDASAGQAELRVTREFGAVPMVDATLDDPTESDTVVRFLDSNADIETSYGGNFVDSIDGYAGSTSGGGDEDWFFFVNGYYSDIGGGERKVRPGDRIWWDYRYWTAAYRVPAVVGSWPEPFLHGYDGERPGDGRRVPGRAIGACDDVVAALGDAGVEPERGERRRARRRASRRAAGPGRPLGRAARRSGGPADSRPARARSGVYAELGRAAGRAGGSRSIDSARTAARSSASTTRGSSPRSARGRTSRPGSSPAPTRRRSPMPPRCSTPTRCATATRSRHGRRASRCAAARRRRRDEPAHGGACG